MAYYKALNGESHNVFFFLLSGVRFLNFSNYFGRR